MTTKAQLQARIDELETALARERRDYQAFADWWICAGRGDIVTTIVVCEAIDLRVELTGLERASGGVAVVHHGPTYRDPPRFVDDLIAEWSQDCAPEIRSAARRIAGIREEQCRVAV